MGYYHKTLSVIEMSHYKSLKKSQSIRTSKRFYKFSQMKRKRQKSKKDLKNNNKKHPRKISVNF